MKDGMVEIDLEKIRALAKPSHNTCLGTGITGVVRGTNIHRICPCVWRALRRRGVVNAEEWRYIRKDPPATGAVSAE
jgi:hypothetical protein